MLEDDFGKGTVTTYAPNGKELVSLGATTDGEALSALAVNPWIRIESVIAAADASGAQATRSKSAPAPTALPLVNWPVSTVDGIPGHDHIFRRSPRPLPPRESRRSRNANYINSLR